MLNHVSEPFVYEVSDESGPDLIHQQVHSRYLTGVLLDVALAPIIDYLAVSGVSTLFSCQGDGGQERSGYIMFPTVQDLLLATKLLADVAISSEDLALAARCLGRDVIESSATPNLRNRVELTNLVAWRFSVSRDPIGWSQETDHFRAYASINHEDILSLRSILGYQQLSH